MKTMKDYHDLYLKCEVLTLADVFETSRNNSLNNYGLCPSHYLSAPSLYWDAMLNMRKVELKLIPDPDMYISFKNGTRGGASYISNRYSKDNNKYLKSYDPKQKSKHITYLEIKIKREILSECQLKIADLYNIPIGNVKKLVPNFFDQEKNVIRYENLQLYLRLGLKLKKYIVY